MHRKSYRRMVLIVFVAITLMASSFVSAYAKTLDESFYYGTNKVCTNTKVVLGQIIYTYKKSCWAGTKGYTGRHYVRAYIGGTSSSPSGAIADTGRCYSSGDIKRTCSCTKSFNEGVLVYFPTAYAKYGI